MKNLKLILIAMMLFVSSAVVAQNDNFNYQAAIRDASGEILENQSVAVVFSIREVSASGTEVYAESHNVTTNDQGLINLSIGSGTATTGTFASIEWSNNNHFLNVEVDGIDLGTSEFKSVPYAASSKTSELAFSGVNNFLVDSTLLIRSGANGQDNSIKTNAEGKLQIMPNGGGIPSVTFDDDNNQNVGIGTENPTEKLEVNGAIKVSGETTNPLPNTVYGNSLPIAYGYLSGNGTTIFNEYGIDSFSKIATGTYEIILDNTFVGNAIVVANSAQGSPRMVDGFASGTSNVVTIRTYDPTGTLIDTQFVFTVFGNIQ